ncbi:unnamed protein product [Ambrosiozyma monospora]|uniref:Unnamed protein product n=1 Tax=Ambrosiozyma monospora TaxID=43982 RepID=A0ACB5T265_AMBMO|nr:unnamed protein product [Ambrosiozyma monospora]
MPTSDEHPIPATQPMELDEEELSANFYLNTIPNDAKREKYTSKTISIPMKSEGEEIVIDAVTDLPDDSSELCTVLTTEDCSYVHWLAVAKAYANQGKVEEAMNVIKQALSNQRILHESRSVQAFITVGSVK